MHLYLVRHGQTINNTNFTHQGPESVLTEVGRNQARYVAERMKQFPIDFILSSTFPRAKETAEIINASLNKEITFTDQLREILQPTEVHGLHFDHPASIEVRHKIRLNVDKQDWHYSDEENFYDYTNRARSFLRELEKYGDKNILAVTHGGFLWALIGVLLYENRLTPELFWPIREFFYSINTGVTIIEKTEQWGWQLKTWNDFAHLNEIS